MSTIIGTDADLCDKTNTPGQQQSREWEPQFYSHKELNFASNLIGPRKVPTAPDDNNNSVADILIQPGEILNRGPWEEVALL